MALYLLTGTPGQSKGNSAQKIASFLRRRGVSVGIGDVEEELLGLFPRHRKSDSKEDPLVGLIGRNSKIEIKDKWPQAYTNAVGKAQKGKPDVAIVVACLEYYRNGTYEYYSPVDCGSVKQTEPVSVLTLIDDVYEMYFRLSQRGQVFDIQALQQRSFPPGRDPKDLRRLYKDALGLVIGSLLRVLVWREKEIACAANLCRTANCQHAVLAAKHPIETGARLLLGKTSEKLAKLGETYSVYVSHPISRPRRDRLRTEDWPSFVKHLDSVVASLSEMPEGERHITPIMPTAIDEYRILDDGTFLHPSLTPRWPLPDVPLLYTQPKAIKGVPPFKNYEDYERRGLSSIFDPPIDSSGRRVGLPLSDAEVSGLLRALKESIRLQMAGRDHLLVGQCPGLFLYRPLYGEFGFSSGVGAELNTFFQLRDYAKGVPGSIDRKVGFIHDNQDAAGLFSPKRNEKSQKEEYHKSVAIEALALQGLAVKIVKRFRGKPKPPKPPGDAAVASALQTSGDPEEAMKVIYDQMFEPVEEGSIGVDHPPPSWEETRDDLKKEMRKLKAASLASDMSEKIRYTFSGDAVQYQHGPPAGEEDTYVDVVIGLDATPERRTQAAVRARTFFGVVTRADSQRKAPGSDRRSQQKRKPSVRR